MPNEQSNLEKQFNQPPQFQEPAPKPKFNLKYILIALILVVIVAGGVLGYQYWWLPRQETKLPEITIQDETANWQTYRNEEYGFEVKYPKEWFIYKDNPADIFIQPEEEKSGTIPGPHADALEIKVRTISSGISLGQAIKNALQGLNFIEEGINIGGVGGLKIKTTCEGVGCGAPRWFVMKNSNLYEFDSNLGYNETFDQILSTFKFIDKTANWQTYWNEKYMFGFKYPEEYYIDSAVDYYDPSGEYYYPDYSEAFSLTLNRRNMEEYQRCDLSISKTDYKNIDEWIKDFLEKRTTPPDEVEGHPVGVSEIISLGDLNISGIKGKKIVEEYGYFCDECISIRAIKDGYLYYFKCYNGEEKFAQDEKILVEKITSSFKFIK